MLYRLSVSILYYFVNLVFYSIKHFRHISRYFPKLDTVEPSHTVVMHNVHEMSTINYFRKEDAAKTKLKTQQGAKRLITSKCHAVTVWLFLWLNLKYWHFSVFLGSKISCGSLIRFSPWDTRKNAKNFCQLSKNC